MNNRIVQIIMDRDDMTRSEAMEMLAEAREMIAEGEDPEEVLYDYFGLEPDYVFDLLEI